MFRMKSCPIIYENDEILIVNKAAGLSVQGGQGVAHPLDEELSKELGYRIHLVHRLDKETCGLLVVAKTPQAAAKWTALIGAKQVKKEYTAVCFGVPEIAGKPLLPGESATIRAPIGKGGKMQEAVTHVTLMRSWELPGTDVTLSLVQLVLGTGRMHQIRIHLALAKSPVVGDDLHGNFKLNRLLRKERGSKLLMLCARRLTVPAPGGKSGRFEVPLPEHILALCGGVL